MVATAAVAVERASGRLEMAAAGLEGEGHQVAGPGAHWVVEVVEMAGVAMEVV